jgi:hypothetical protein
VFDGITFEEIFTFDPRHRPDPHTFVDLSTYQDPAGSPRIAVAGSDRRLRVLDGDNGTVLRLISVRDAELTTIYGLSSSEDGRPLLILATGPSPEASAMILKHII